MKQLTDEVFEQVINELRVASVAHNMLQAFGHKKRTDYVIATLTAAQQAQPESHLFEFWWAEYMPEATQEQAFKAWSAAPSSKDAGVEQQAQPERAPLSDDELSDILLACMPLKDPYKLMRAIEARILERDKRLAVFEQAQPEPDGKLLREFLDAAKRNGVTHLTIAQPEPKDFQELAKVHASSYASPHHITFTTDGLKRFVAAQLKQAVRDAYEEAAKTCDGADKSTHPADLADRIRALIEEIDA